MPIKVFLFATLLSLTSFKAMGQKTIDIKDGDNTIHLNVFGEIGTPVLIINGGPGMNSNGFADLAKTISKNNKAIIYDQRGTGESSIPLANRETITMDHMVADIEIIRRHLKLDTWIVFGHSFGGMLASYYAAQHPERISKLILSSSGGIDMELFSGLNITSRLTEKQRNAVNYWARKIANGDTTYHARINRAKNLAPAYLYNKSFVPKIAERLTQVNMQINTLVFQNMRTIDFDCKEKLFEFKKPVLIIQGKQDIVGEHIAEKAHNTFPNSKLVLLENCAHYGWLDQPVQYFNYIDTFLKTPL